MNTCRFCHLGDREDEHRLPLIKYGVRHYGHPDCLLEAKGAAFFKELFTWQLNNFPYFAAHRAGLAKELEAEIQRREKNNITVPAT